MYASAIDYSANPTPAQVPQQGGQITGRVTEIIQHSREVSLSPLLLPMLAQLSRQNRWLAIVGAPAEITRESLAEAGVDMEHLWFLKPSRKHSTLDLASRALKARTCHAVVSWHPDLDEAGMGQLQLSAACSDTQGIVVRGGH
ncbi:SulA-like leucine-rich domain-containing protein [Marinobacterium lutimaris]|uniref:SOS cell division inhibitor SulA n=1 Tax=Marinobacterium lutimaris TaxID=568106 RepID=A0A1H5UQ94_9GAMM|nr:SulA-like leucine-rich domain-containing protein [Marinobacterium lutimaris]SEF76357.1 SOS cell division inhibitor SulA [Marinobacterium lutimaris]